MKSPYSFLILSIFFFNCGDNSSKSVNHPPVIESLTAEPDTVNISETTRLHCVGSDPDNDILNYAWSALYGTFTNGSAGTRVLWLAPEDPGTYSVAVNVTDGQFSDSETVDIVVAIFENSAPIIESLLADPAIIPPTGITNLTCMAEDPDGDSLTYTWLSDAGNFPNGANGPSVQWQAPENFGDYYIQVSVSDGQLSVADSVAVTVVEPPAVN